MKIEFLEAPRIQYHFIFTVCWTEELPRNNVAEAQKLLLNSVQYCDQLIHQFNDRWVGYCDNDMIYTWLQ